MCNVIEIENKLAAKSMQASNKQTEICCHYNTFHFCLTLQVQWKPSEDRGPNGAEGRASFDPIISVALIVTLYRVCIVPMHVHVL